MPRPVGLHSAPVATEASEAVVITHPNRDKPQSKATKAGVVLLLVISAALIAVITVGGWEKLQGAQGVAIAYVIITLVMAYFVLRWNRGVLPLAAAFAILFGVMAAIAAPAWFARDKAGFEDPALPPGLLGLLTLVVIGVQVLLIIFTVRGFTQAWNVEVEVPRDRADDYDDEHFDYANRLAEEGRTGPEAQPGTMTDPQADRGPQDPEQEGGADVGEQRPSRQGGDDIKPE